MALPSSIAGATTQQVGYFACDVATLVSWIRDGLDGNWVERQPGWSSLADAAIDLAPSPLLSRYACVPLPDTWTLVLTNGPHGTDLGVLPSYAARELGCRAIRAVRVDDEATFPARILEVYGPDGDLPLSLERSVVAANDGGQWVFETSGVPHAFENQDAYGRTSKAARFTGEMLDSYLRALGVPTHFEPLWPDALLVEQQL